MVIWDHIQQGVANWLSELRYQVMTQKIFVVESITAFLVDYLAGFKTYNMLYITLKWFNISCIFIFYQCFILRNISMSKRVFNEIRIGSHMG